MKYPTLQEEKRLWKKGYKRVACLDEAGRGPLSGPVIAAAVIIKPCLKWKFKHLQIKDSKKLTPKRRKELYKILINPLRQLADGGPQIKWGIGRVSEKVIDKINILEATKLAMKRAIQKLNKKPKFLIIDGNFKINSSISQKSIIKADEKVFSCAVASILAKVTRDRMMERYHQKYPKYGFDRHKGYPTKLHRKMLKKYGPCKIHRKSFKPVKTCKPKKFLLN
ncbi:MAG: ribonuclease HII [Candidatus Nealsonbacteria bacterium]|nr:MAG: ribonuclease HII [Candidatus Nealsonbacteria bacterium]